MKQSFGAANANLVCFLTSAKPGRAPRVDGALLRETLSALAFEGRADELLLLSRHSGGVDGVREDARYAYDKVQSVPGEEVASEEILQRALHPLRARLEQFELFALVTDDGTSDTFTREAAQALDELTLQDRRPMLIFAWRGSPAPADVVDPTPPILVSLENPQNWPGVLLWNRDDQARQVTLSELSALGSNISARLGRPHSSEPLVRPSSGRRPRTLLHLSDLHFGGRFAAQNQPLLDGQLHQAVASVDRVVITGDLFDEPNAQAANLYRTFEASLTRLANGRKPIIVPGNHDQRMKGNVGKILDHVANIGWAATTADDDAGLLFACFNSCESGSFARGAVSAEQYARVAGQMQTLIAGLPERSSYLRVALIHHHPISFETQRATRLQRFLATFGLSDEKFLKMIDGDRFVEWCARWNISAILHGHKHVPRKTSQSVAIAGAPAVEVTAIGCGSSLGAESLPMSYVLLTWDDISRRWTTTFYESENSGPFAARAVSMTPALQSPPT